MDKKGIPMKLLHGMGLILSLLCAACSRNPETREPTPSSVLASLISGEMSRDERNEIDQWQTRVEADARSKTNGMPLYFYPLSAEWAATVSIASVQKTLGKAERISEHEIPGLFTAPKKTSENLYTADPINGQYLWYGRIGFGFPGTIEDNNKLLAISYAPNGLPPLSEQAGSTNR